MKPALNCEEPDTLELQSFSSQPSPVNLAYNPDLDISESDQPVEMTSQAELLEDMMRQSGEGMLSSECGVLTADKATLSIILSCCVSYARRSAPRRFTCRNSSSLSTNCMLTIVSSQTESESYSNLVSLSSSSDSSITVSSAASFAELAG